LSIATDSVTSSSERFRGDAGALQGARRSRRIALSELARRQVHRHAQVRVPDSRQRRDCAQAVSNTHCPMGMMSPVSSAMGINSRAITMRATDACQRMSASTPPMWPVRRSHARLVKQAQLVALERAAQRRLELQALRGGRIHSSPV